MRYKITEVIRLLLNLLRTMFSKRVLLIAEPSHPNLGDQAQLMCTEKWIAETYPDRTLVKVGMLFSTIDCRIVSNVLNIGLIKLLLLKLFVKKNDIFIGHSGYFFVDHHSGWLAYYTLLNNFKNRMIILPQTINFYTPYFKEIASETFSDRKNLTLLCRDEVSYKNAQEMFL